MHFSSLIEKLINKGALTEEESFWAMKEILGGSVSHIQASGFLKM